MQKKNKKPWKKQKKAKPLLGEFFLTRSETSKIQELRIGRDIGGRRVPRSGAIPGLRGDAENSRFLVEAKQTKKPYFFLSERILQRIDKEAFGERKTPAVVIEFLSMPCGAEASWVAIQYGLLKKSIEDFKLYTKSPDKLKTKGFRLKVEMHDLKDLDIEATSKGKIPVMICEFQWISGAVGIETKWAMIPYNVFVKIANPETPYAEVEEDT